MQIKRENKSLMGLLCLLVTLLGCTPFIGINQLHAQCEILVNEEPDDTFKQKSPKTISETRVRSTYGRWQDMDAASGSDDMSTYVDIPGKIRSNYLDVTDFKMNLPVGATILGITVLVEGRVEGEGSEVLGSKLRLLDAEGKEVGEDRAKHVSAGSAFPEQGTDAIWQYGGYNRTWDVANLNEDFLNSENFGVRLQVRNRGEEDARVYIDQIRVRVDYVPIYAICDHDCITFFVRENSNAVNYKWWVPENFDVIPGTDVTNFINITAYNDVKKDYEICVDIMGPTSVLGTCCRKFLLDDCTPSNIGDRLFLDRNADGIQDPVDSGIRDIAINLFTESGDFVASTMTNGAGGYVFIEQQKGFYYIQAALPDEYAPSLSFQGTDDTSDSNLSNENGYGTTDVFYVGPGENEFSIDLGIFRKGQVGNYVWNDINGDGLQGFTEPALEGVQVQLYSSEGTLIDETTSGADGIYLFDFVVPGDYYVQLVPFGDFNITTKGMESTKFIDNDLNSDGTSDIFSVEPNEIKDDIDIGLFKGGSIGDYVWFDEDEDGLQGESEAGFENIEISLFNSGDILVSSVLTNVDGSYNFLDVAPGQYYVSLAVPTDYQGSLANIGSDDEIDSDFSGVGDVLISETFDFLSCDTITNIDAGLQLQRATISGVAWLDLANDNNRDNDDPFREGVVVTLFDEAGSEITTTTTNANGQYIFENLLSGNYYVVFDNTADYYFTLANIGSEDVDSDVTNFVSDGSTDIITLAPGDIAFADAGYGGFATIGDFVWEDINLNAVQDPNELDKNGINDIIVSLFASDGTLIGRSTTNDKDGVAGYYSFSGVFPGEYYVGFGLPIGFVSTANIQVRFDENSDITGANGPNTTDVFTVISDQILNEIDAGILDNASNISGVAWCDANEDGIRTTDEEFISGVLIELYNGSQNVVGTAVTNETGSYTFENIEVGSYYLDFGIPTNKEFTIADQGDDEELDSDVTNRFGEGTTGLFLVNIGDDDMNFDAGYTVPKGSIEGLTWLDENMNGTRDASEELLVGYQISLEDADGNVVATDETNFSGLYSFSDISIGTYTIVFPGFDDRMFTAPNTGSDDTNSDAIPIGNMANASVTVLADQATANVDAGYVLCTGDISGNVWLDMNNNAINDFSDIGLIGIQVDLMSLLEGVVNTTFTDDTGAYGFADVKSGQYFLRFTTLAGFVFVDANIGNELTDSDVTGDNGIGSTDLLFLPLGGFDIQNDAGIIDNTSDVMGIAWCDANGNGVRESGEEPLPGVTVILYDEAGNEVSSGTTVADGRYFFSQIAAGNYYMIFSEIEEKEFTLPNILNEVTDSDVTNAFGIGSTDIFELLLGGIPQGMDAGYQEINRFASLGNRVWHDLNANGIADANEPGINNVTVSLYTAEGILVNSTNTLSNTSGAGFYSFSEIEEGDYYLKFEAPTGYIYSLANASTDVRFDSNVTGANGPGTTNTFTATRGTDVDYDAGIYQNAVLGDFVWNDSNYDGRQSIGETGYNDVNVSVFTALGVLVDQQTTQTLNGVDGSYSFELTPGDYYIKVDLPSNINFTEPFTTSSPTNDSDINFANGNGTSETFTLSSGDINNDVDAGVYEEPGDIGNFVWFDMNADGIYDADEVGVNGMNIYLFTDDGFLRDTTSTRNGPDGLAGFYMFDNIPPGVYYLKFKLNSYLVSPADQGGNDTKDSDITGAFGEGTTNLIFLSPGERDMDVDAGIYPPAFLGNYVWSDENRDGIQDESEPGIGGVEVLLLDQFGTLIASQFTDDTGRYGFGELAQGVYQVRFMIPEVYQATGFKVGETDLNDSDITPTGDTPLISLASGAINEDLDAGFMPAGSLLGSLVWHDRDGDGVQDSGEEGLEGVEMQLKDTYGNTVITTETNNRGEYLFTNIPDGQYYVQAMAPDNYRFTNEDGDDLSTNNDVDATGKSRLYTITSDLYQKNIDVGMFIGGNIATRAWYDSDGDGMMDDDESNVADVEVELMDQNSEMVSYAVSTGESDEFGANLTFADLDPGFYFLVYNPAGELIATVPFEEGGGLFDSDVMPYEEGYRTSAIIINSDQSVFSYNAGFYVGAKLGNRIWNDVNENGIQDEYETGLSEVNIILKKASDGSIVQETISDSEGYFGFNNIMKGDYYLHFDLETSFTFSDPNAIADDEMDSDVTNKFGDGTTDLVSVGPDQQNYNVDAGVTAGVLAIDDASLAARFNADHNEIRITPVDEVDVISYELFRRYESEEWALHSTVLAENKGEYLVRDYDIEKAGNYYYQIKEIDNNGRKAESRVVSVRVIKDNSTILSLYPNPSVETIFVEEKDGEQIQSFELVDQMGRIAKTFDQSHAKIEGLSRTHKLNVNNITPGKYILNIKYNDYSVAESVLVIR